MSVNGAISRPFLITPNGCTNAATTDHAGAVSTGQISATEHAHETPDRVDLVGGFCAPVLAGGALVEPPRAGRSAGGGACGWPSVPAAARGPPAGRSAGRGCVLVAVELAGVAPRVFGS